MKKKFLPETQKLINLFQSMPLAVQSEYRQWISDTDPLFDWDIEIDKIDWGDLEKDMIDWGTELDKMDWGDMEKSNENEEQKLSFYCNNCMKFIIK